MYIKVSDTQFKRRASKYKEQKKPLSQILLPHYLCLKIVFTGLVMNALSIMLRHPSDAN